MLITPEDEPWMQQALRLAEQAEEQDEVPVGALLVLDNQLIAEGFNSPISSNDPTAHAEIIALRNGAKALKNYRLLNTTLYVTLEPCAMCAYAMIHARIKRLVYAADDPRTGAAGSVIDIFNQPAFNHRVTVHAGLCAEQSSELLKRFFKVRRR